MVENKTKSNIKSEIRSLLIVVIIALLIRIFIIELFVVPTGSMKETILENDYIFSTKYSYGYSKYSIPFSPNLFSGRIFETKPTRGDIVIMRPPHDMDKRYIKRLIAMPFEKIEIKNNVTYINDKPVTRKEIGEVIGEDGTIYLKFLETLPNGLNFYSYKLKYAKNKFGDNLNDFGPYIIPEGHFFFMGDNRDLSGDSRYQLGFVPFENFIAKAQFVIFSTEKILWDPKLNLIEQISGFGSWLASIRFRRLLTNMYNQ